MRHNIVTVLVGCQLIHQMVTELSVDTSNGSCLGELSDGSCLGGLPVDTPNSN